jgi:hypothetical protein
MHTYFASDLSSALQVMRKVVFIFRNAIFRINKTLSKEGERGREERRQICDQSCGIF